MKTFFKKNKIPLFISTLCAIFVVFLNDFVFNRIDRVFNVTMFTQKMFLGFYILIAIVVLSLIFFLIYYFIKNRSCYKVFIKHFLIYFSVMFVFLLLLWPGIIKGDEYYVINSVLNLNFSYMQHYLTSVFYLVSLCIFPTFGTITLMQIFIISLIVAYILSFIEGKIRYKKFIYLFYLVLFLPPVIDNNLFTLRSSLVAYLFLLMIFCLLVFHENGSKKFLILSLFLSALVGVWKSELIYVPVLVFFYVLLFCIKPLNFKNVFLYFMVLLIFYVVISMPQKEDSKYKMTAVVNPLSVMILEDKIVQELNDDDFNNINNLIPIKDFKNYSDYENIFAYNIYMAGQEYTKSEIRNFLFTYVKIVMNNPLSFLKARYKTFRATNYSGPYERPNHTGAEYPASQWTSSHPWYFDMHDKFNYTRGILNSNQKKKIILCLLLRDINYKPYLLNHLFYDVVPISFVGIIYAIYCLILKNWKRLLLLTIIMTQLFLIFLTAPASFWMYYMCLYLVLHFVLLYFFILYLDNKRTY